MMMLHTTDLAVLGWSRAQFALTACYHWLFVPLTLGLALVMAIMETCYYRTGDEFWKKTAQFWQKLFGINFAIGVATGIILEFEFGTNWSNYSWFVGDIFGAPLAIEGILAFFMESTFIALMDFNPDTVRNEMMDFFGVAFQPFAVNKFCHTVSSGWLTGAVFVVAVSCWFLLRRRNVKLATQSIKIAAIVGLVAGLIVALTGDRSGEDIARHQPMKLAAAEGLRQGSAGAPFSIVPGVEVPGALSLVAHKDLKAFVPGIDDILYHGYTDNDGNTVLPATEKMKRGATALAAFKDYRAARGKAPERADSARKVFEDNKAYFGYGYIQKVEDLVPPLGMVYWSFRVMVGAGCALILIMALLIWYGRKGTLTEQRWLLHVGLWSLVLVYLAEQAGWIVAEVGRQPWAIQDLLPVNAAVSSLSVTNVQITFALFFLVFTALLIAELRIMFKAIANHRQE